MMRCLLLSTVLIRFIDVIITVLSNSKALLAKLKSDGDDADDLDGQPDVSKSASQHSGLLASKLILVMIMTSLLTMVFFVSMESELSMNLLYSCSVCSYFGSNTTNCLASKMMLTHDDPLRIMTNKSYEGRVVYLKVGATIVSHTGCQYQWL